MMPAVSFVRLSRHIAVDRMQRALRNACVERILESENDCTDETQTTLEHLYKSYCDRDATYNIADAYYTFRRRHNKCASKPVSSLCSQSAYGVHYSLIRTDDDDDAGSSTLQAQAPLLVLATKDVMLYGSFLQTLDELSY